ncbi:MAG: hypothetical protein COB98_01625 [Flavobacteriaceae bacterium]|nr:MAG: hypothetical protein COB98_01625 [Flavobacteriaceae bacterium]
MAQITEVRLTIAAIIYAIEIDLKNLVTKYITPFNDNLNFIGSKETISSTIKRYKKDNPNLPVEGNIDEVIQYLDFADFFKIILSNKSFFNDHIIDEIKKSLPELESIIGIRNRVMHTRPLMNSDFAVAVAFGKKKQEHLNDIWYTLNSTLTKIEEDPSYVLTLTIPSTKSIKDEAHHNLPIPDFDETGFIGRKKDLVDIQKLILGNNRVVTVMGEGGVGKTALALKVAYDILDLGAKNPFDIIIWISAKTTMLTVTGIQEIRNTLVDYAGVIQGINDALPGINKEDDQLSTILEYMELFDTLLIIDNLETILDEKIREFIREASQISKLLITSRIGLGELEFRRPLKGLSDKESILLIRGLANLKKSTVLNRLENKQLIDIVHKLHYNPLSLKWFVNSVETGISPNDVLNNRGNLLDFCLTNVYDKLSEDAIVIIQTILAARRNLNDAELVYTTELASLKLRRAMNELFSTTFISREIEHIREERDLRYSIPAFSKEYILKHHPIPSKYIKTISERLRSLKTSTSNINRVSGYNEFGINALSISNANEKVVARLLNDALRFSKGENLDDALNKINEAKSILPNYAEIYRVSGFIKASSDDILGAESDYKTGLEIDPENPRLLYFYGSFLLYSLNDWENAFDYVAKLNSIRPDSEYPTLLFARILSTSGDYVKAVDLLNNLLVKSSLTKNTIRIINTDLIGVYSYWARATVEKEGDFDLAITKFKQAITIYEDSVNSRNYDSRMTKAFCNVLKSYLKQIPKLHNQENADDISDLIIKYDDQITLNQSKEYLTNLLSNVFGIIRTNQEIYSGEVSTINPTKNFAFIAATSGKEFYANKKAFKFSSDFNLMQVGMPVTFELGTNKQGDCAINIEAK